jgi:hypothetical protein
MVTFKHTQKFKTPELDKMSLIQDKSQAIGGFIEWLGERDPQLYLCECAKEEEGFFPVYPNIEKLLAEYFEIDLDKIEKERRELLDYVRQQNKKEDKTK